MANRMYEMEPIITVISEDFNAGLRTISWSQCHVVGCPNNQTGRVKFPKSACNRTECGFINIERVFEDDLGLQQDKQDNVRSAQIHISLCDSRLTDDGWTTRMHEPHFPGPARNVPTWSSGKGGSSSGASSVSFVSSYWKNGDESCNV